MLILRGKLGKLGFTYLYIWHAWTNWHTKKTEEVLTQNCIAQAMLGLHIRVEEDFWNVLSAFHGECVWDIPSDWPRVAMGSMRM